MEQTQKLMKFLHTSLTAYHAVENAKKALREKGFSELFEGDIWELREGGKYFVERDGSALIAFSVGSSRGGFRIVASHTDSPCWKVKGNAVTFAGGCAKLNVERYGGVLYYSFLDIPLRLAGRAVYYDEASGSIHTELVTEKHTVVIPSVAIHFQRDANTALSLNPQTDMQPIVSLRQDFSLSVGKEGKEPLESDLFLVNATEPFLAGFDDEFLVSPRIDNLTSACASVEALTDAPSEGIAMIYLADNEEVGSHTKQGAGSDFLVATMARITNALGGNLETMLPHTFVVSCDNAHAIHPNHPEKSDPTNPVRLGGGIVIKHHANQNYTTDAVSSAVFKAILQGADVPYQDFYMRSDMPCGGTLGAISSTHVSVRSVDIGLAQLAMHSATETMCVADYPRLIRALRAFFDADITATSAWDLKLTK